MSDDTLDRRFKFPHTTAGMFHLVSAGIAGGLLLWVIQSVRFIPTSIFILLALVILGGIGYAWMPIVVFTFLAVILFEVPNHFLGVLPNFDAPLSLPELTVSALFVIYASFSYRFSRSRIEPVALTPAPSDSSPAMPKADMNGVTPAMIGSLVVIIVGGIAAAYAARWFLPFLYVGRRWGEVFRLHPGVLGFLFALLLIGLVSALWPAIIRAIGRWGMNRLEGEMILNETLYRDLRPDIARMARFFQRFKPRRK